MQASKRIIALFDLDQTLTPARKFIEKAMVETIKAVHDKGVAIGIVSGSDLHKIQEQVGEEFVKNCDFVFS